jgi:hypothetical protein
MENNMAQPKVFERPLEHENREHEPSEVPVLTPEESRQGVVSGRVLTVLTAALFLAMIAFIVVYAIEII